MFYKGWYEYGSNNNNQFHKNLNEAKSKGYQEIKVYNDNMRYQYTLEQFEGGGGYHRSDEYIDY